MKKFIMTIALLSSVTSFASDSHRELQTACNEYRAIVGEQCLAVIDVAPTTLEDALLKIDSINEIASSFNGLISSPKVSKEEREQMIATQIKFRQYAAGLAVDEIHNLLEK